MYHVTAHLSSILHTYDFQNRGARHNPNSRYYTSSFFFIFRMKVSNEWVIKLWEFFSLRVSCDSAPLVERGLPHLLVCWSHEQRTRILADCAPLNHPASRGKAPRRAPHTIASLPSASAQSERSKHSCESSSSNIIQFYYINNIFLGLKYPKSIPLKFWTKIERKVPRKSNIIHPECYSIQLHKNM